MKRTLSPVGALFFAAGAALASGRIDLKEESLSVADNTHYYRRKP